MAQDSGPNVDGFSPHMFDLTIKFYENGSKPDV